jgi:hypothetical protein
MANAHYTGTGLLQYPNPNDNIYLAGQSFTLMAWVKVATNGGGVGNNLFFSMGQSYSATTNTYLCAGIDSSNCLRMSFGAEEIKACSPSFTATGSWQHVAFQFDASFGIQTLWSNGFLVKDRFSSSFTGTGAVSVGGCPLNTAFGGSLSGLLDELHLWQRVLSPAEIYDAAIYDSYPNLYLQVVWLGFEESKTSTYAKDQSGHGFHFWAFSGTQYESGANPNCLPTATQFAFKTYPTSTITLGNTGTVTLAVLDPFNFQSNTFSYTEFSGYCGLTCTGSAICPSQVNFSRSTGSFQIYDSVAETVTLCIVDSFGTGYTVPQCIAVTFGYAPWTAVRFSSTPAASAQPGGWALATLIAIDVNDNMLPTAAGTVSVSVNGTAELSSSIIVISGGVGYVSVRSNVTGNFRLTLTNSQPIASLTTLTAGLAFFTGTAVSIRATYNASSSSCDWPTLLTLTLVDAYGNAVFWDSNSTRTLVVSMGGSGQSPGTVTLSSGQATVLLFDRVAESVVVSFASTANTSSLTLPSPSTLTYTAGTPTQFVIVDPYTTTNGPYTGATSFSVRVEIRDAWGNIVSMSATATLYVGLGTATVSNAGVLTFTAGVATLTVGGAAGNNAVLRVRDSATTGFSTNTAQTVYWYGTACVQYKVQTPSTVSGVYNLRVPLNVTVACLTSAGAIDTTYSGQSCGLASNSIYLTSVMNCRFFQGVCWAGMYATRSGSYLVTPTNLQGSTIATLTGATFSVTPTAPVVWSASSDGCVTQGGCTYSLKGIAFTDGGVCSTAPTVQFYDSITAVYSACSVLSYNFTDISCVTGGGQGVPEVVVTVCGTRQSHLPRWPNDVFFFQGSNIPQSIFPYCLNMVNFLDQYTHLWSLSYFCGVEGRGVVDWLFFQPNVNSYNNPVPTWYSNNYRCVQIYEPREWYTNQGFGSWPNDQFCYPAAIPWTLTYSRSGPISGQFCVPILQSQDPYWIDGLHYLCNPKNLPYGTDLILKYHYATPYIQSIGKGTGLQVGQVTLTGINFGYGTADQVLISGDECAPVVFWNDTQIICYAPAGMGSSNPLYITIESSIQSNTVIFAYDPPQIISIGPQMQYSQGGDFITVVGGNFGPCCTGMLSVAGLGCSFGPSIAGSSWNATVVICQLPQGAGLDQPVYVSIGGQRNSIPGSYNYSQPIIYALSPESYDSQGGATLFVNGTSFSLTSTTRIGPFICTPLRPQTHTAIYCQLPGGQGANLSVTVTNSVGQVSNPSGLFSYLPPFISSLTPSGAVSGTNVFLTLAGVSFGLSGVVYIGPNLCDLSQGVWLHTVINCKLPAGAGANLPVYLVVGGQTSNTVYFSYAPVISAVYIADGSAGYTSGGSKVHLSGSGFSLPSTAAATILIGGRDCTELDRNDTDIDCTLPSGQASSNLVQVSVSGQSSNTMNFAYAVPVITSVFPPMDQQ